MKTIIWLPAAGLVLASVVVLGQSPALPAQNGDPGASAEETESDFPPKRFEPRRYDAIFKKNPFMQEVVPVEEETPDDPWADGLELKAVSRIGGKFVVHVANTKLVGDEDREKRKMAYHRLVEGDDREALRIQSVKPHRDPAQVEVIVATGAGSNVKTAAITYSEQQLKASAPAQVKPPQAGQGRRPTTTRRTVNPRSRRPTTNRTQATPKRRVILPPGLPGATQQ